MTPRIEMIGKRFGRLVVLALSEEHGSRGQLKYICKCDCGQIKHVLGESLRSLKCKSCGCLNKEIISKKMTTHGESDSRLYKIWQGMKNRCENENSEQFKDYGGKGVKVCEEWHEYTNFRNFMMSNGYDPSAPQGECTIERVDVNGNYEPANCKIIPQSLQNFNKTNNNVITYNGKTQTVTEWARELNIKADVIFMRLHRGKTVEEALSTPIRKVRMYTVGEETHTCKEWAELLEMPWSTLREKVRVSGKSMEQIVFERREFLGRT